ncbi:hypothetical protein [Notoacmeibacter sp. MSK16QG-6]|uniref:hypothetical protein n=1 Tax=Notoacmeibacter sp. MSK16QG-6 TaxID=2957982 RepID=UPI0020A03DFA|nr:hypothetical protein [Notoacmeibacter sp. MSK16QG-6]MCP1199850.1 hypothetical protein [Notoacmeibacter sp. MSK16QG-6]
MAKKVKSSRSEVVKSNDKTEAARAVDKYNAAVASSELKSIMLTDVSFNVKPDFFSQDLEKQKLVSNIEQSEPLHEEGEDIGVSFVEFKVSSREGRKQNLVCKARYAVIYGGFSQCNAKEVKHFLSRVGTFACYPYFRSLFANLNWSANVELPPLPVLKESVVPRQNKKSDEANE